MNIINLVWIKMTISHKVNNEFLSDFSVISYGISSGVTHRSGSSLTYLVTAVLTVFLLASSYFCSLYN